MSSLSIHKEMIPEEVFAKRSLEFYTLPFEVKWNRIVHLISLSRALSKRNTRKPNKITLTRQEVIYNED